MIGRLWVNKCQVCHWRVSSLLFMPNGCKVLALVIKWASRAFLTESRLLRTSSMGMRWTSLMEWPAWLKCNETGVVMLSCWWFLFKSLVVTVRFSFHIFSFFIHSAPDEGLYCKPKYRAILVLSFYFDLVISAVGISVPPIFCIQKFLLIQVYLRSGTLIGLLLWLYSF